MTWAELAHTINTDFTEEQKGQDVTVFLPDMDAYFGCGDSLLEAKAEDNDQLDPGHKYIYVDQ